jgi:hypothetical protein
MTKPLRENVVSPRAGQNPDRVLLIDSCEITPVSDETGQWSRMLLAPTRIPGKTAGLKTRLPYWQTQKADGLDYHRLGGGDCFERGA